MSLNEGKELSDLRGAMDRFDVADVPIPKRPLTKYQLIPY